MGYGIGLELKEAALAITEKNERTVELHMVFMVSLNLEGLTRGQKGITWPLALSDVVSVESGGPVVLTSGVSK